MQERERINARSQIKPLGETIRMIKSIRSHLSKKVIELSGTLRENVQSKTALPNEEIELTYTMLDRYRKAVATQDQILASLGDLQTELKNKIDG